MNNPDAEGAQFVGDWVQIATHFKDAPPTVLFELLNEPNGKLDAPKWNALLARTLATLAS